MLFSFGGGLFVPLSQFAPVLQTAATLTPCTASTALVHAPLAGTPSRSGRCANVLVWLVVFVAGAVWRFRRDTARV